MQTTYSTTTTNTWSSNASNITNTGVQDPSTTGGKGKGESWLMAIAKALGHALGLHAANLVKLSKQLDTLAGKDQKDPNNAAAFQKTMTEFQAESQLFSMLSNAVSTAIKSIGEGMTSIARKQ